MDTLVKKAYDNWMHVVEYDGKSLLSLGQNKTSVASQNDLTIGSQNHSTSFDQQINLPSLPASISSEQPAMNTGLNMGGINMYYCLTYVLLLKYKFFLLCFYYCLGFSVQFLGDWNNNSPLTICSS